MKKIVLVLIVALMGTVAMNAQPPRGEKMLQERMNQLEKVLNLDKEQKEKITEIMKEGMSHMEKDQTPVKPDEAPDNADRKSRREGMENRFAAIDGKIAAVLTPEQQEKYKELRMQERKQRHEGPRGHGPRDPRHGDHPKQKPNDGGCCNKDNAKGCCDQPKDVEKVNKDKE